MDGTINCTGKPNGCMVTEKEYGDYVLKVKWRSRPMARAATRGVLLHVQDEKYWPTSVEAQMLVRPRRRPAAHQPARREARRGQVAARPEAWSGSFFRIETKEPVEKKLGEWNEYEITCKGGDITLVVNGVKVNEGKNCNFTKGRIALQSEGAEIYFKDVVIKSLK